MTKETRAGTSQGKCGKKIKTESILLREFFKMEAGGC